jgi:hypothetical protein
VWGSLLRPGEEMAEPGLIQAEKEFYSPLCPVTLGLADRLLFGVTSTQADQVINKIYLNSKSQVAIVAPAADTKNQTQLKDQPLDHELNSGRPANEVIPDPL